MTHPFIVPMSLSNRGLLRGNPCQTRRKRCVNPHPHPAELPRTHSSVLAFHYEGSLCFGSPSFGRPFLKNSNGLAISIERSVMVPKAVALAGHSRDVDDFKLDPSGTPDECKGCRTSWNTLSRSKKYAPNTPAAVQKSSKQQLCELSSNRGWH